MSRVTAGFGLPDSFTWRERDEMTEREIAEEHRRRERVGLDRELEGLEARVREFASRAEALGAQVDREPDLSEVRIEKIRVRRKLEELRAQVELVKVQRKRVR